MRPSTNTIDDNPPSTGPVEIQRPEGSHGADMWRIARDSGSLDLNSSYAYLLLARDFAATSRVAVLGGEVVGFAVGYRYPDAPDRLFLWQVAVDERARGQRVAARLLDDLLAGLEDVTALETTITDDNAASQRLFTSLAARHGASITKESGFSADDFPDGHDAEALYVVAPLGPGRG